MKAGLFQGKGLAKTHSPDDPRDGVLHHRPSRMRYSQAVPGGNGWA